MYRANYSVLVAMGAAYAPIPTILFCHCTPPAQADAPEGIPDDTHTHSNKLIDFDNVLSCMVFTGRFHTINNTHLLTLHRTNSIFIA